MASNTKAMSSYPNIMASSTKTMSSYPNSNGK